VAGFTSRITDALSITSTITDAPLEFSRALAAALGISPAVAMTLILERSLAAAHGITPDAAEQLTVARQLAAGIGVSPSVIEALVNPRALAASPSVSPAVAEQITIVRQLASGLGISPAVVETLINPRSLAATPAIAPAVAEVLTNPRALAAAVGITPSVATTLKNARALAAALGISPAVAMTLTVPFSSPANIAGLVAWFDMLDAASFTNTAGFISSITNKASGVAWTEATNRPAYSATAISAHPGMDFNGTSHRIISTEAAVWQAVNPGNAYTLFYVAAFDTLDRSEAVFSGANSATSTGIRAWGQSTTGAGRWAHNTIQDSAVAINSESSGGSSTGVHVFCWHASSTQVSMQLDNGSADPNNGAHSPGATTMDRAALGCRPRSSPTLFFDGRLGELVLYNSRLSSTDITNVANYLAARWA
jgi:hypothetical protein